jgi:hypothetical protein
MRNLVSATTRVLRCSRRLVLLTFSLAMIVASCSGAPLSSGVSPVRAKLSFRPAHATSRYS